MQTERDTKRTVSEKRERRERNRERERNRKREREREYVVREAKSVEIERFIQECQRKE
jgi:hypothetical protein